MVRSVDPQAVVVDADAGVGVAGGDGDLEGGGEGVGGCGVELVDGGVLEGEGGFGGAQDYPDYEDRDDYEDNEGEEKIKESLVELLAPVPASVTVLAAVVFNRHDRREELQMRERERRVADEREREVRCVMCDVGENMMYICSRISIQMCSVGEEIHDVSGGHFANLL